LRTFLVRFWAVAVSLSALVGLYVAAGVADKLPAFWGVLALAVVIVSVQTYAKKIPEIITRVRNYPVLLHRVVFQQEELETLRAGERAALGQIESVWEAGVKEGRAEFAGAFLCVDRETPAVESVTERDGKLCLVGSYNDPEIKPYVGARYFVSLMGGDDYRGVVELSAHHESRQLCFLKCVEATRPEFWEHLAQRVAIDASPPPGIELIPYGVTTTIRSYRSQIGQVLHNHGAEES
jgi:hypothetical protein